jgi:hypothetical protein
MSNVEPGHFRCDFPLHFRGKKVLAHTLTQLKVVTSRKYPSSQTTMFRAVSLIRPCATVMPAFSPAFLRIATSPLEFAKFRVLSDFEFILPLAQPAYFSAFELILGNPLRMPLSLISSQRTPAINCPAKILD